MHRAALVTAVALFVSLSSAGMAQAPPAGSAQAAFGSESQWIVSDVVTAIARLTRPDTVRSSKSAAPDPSVSVASGRVAVTITSAQGPRTLSPTGGVWSVESYAAIAQALMGSAAAPAAGTTADLNARGALTTLRTDVLLDENDRIAGVLRRDLHSASAHESAALLVGALGLREAWGLFSDVRPALSRMTAHLAVAKALRRSGPSGRDGALATIVLAALAGRQREAVALIERFEASAESPADRIWARALRLRVTGDWRAMKPSSRDSLLERLEYGRAIRARLGPDKLLDHLDSQPPDELPDWHRIAFRDGDNSETRHRFTHDNLLREMHEMDVVKTRLGPASAATDLVGALNMRPGVAVASGSLQVLDWGTWAGFLQRHLCQALLTYDYLQAGQGRGDREQLAQGIDAAFKDLSLYPVVARWTARSPAEHARAMAGARSLLARRPEVVTAASWNLLTEDVADTVAPPAPLRDFDAWFGDDESVGPFDRAARALHVERTGAGAREEAARWSRENPFDHQVLWHQLMISTGNAPSAAAARAALGELLGYDAESLVAVLDDVTLPAEERLTLARTLCAMAPVHCDRVGESLLLLNRDGDAAEAYERWIQKARDRVAVSNGVTWIVRYHDSHGRHDRAGEIATMAAETGSAGGLEVLGEFLERQGDYDKAEVVFRLLADRHDGSKALLGAFLMRRSARTNDPSVDAEAATLLTAQFPRGLEPLALPALEARPSDGVTFSTLGERAVLAGIKAGDVLVGLDDWRVRSAGQYTIVVRLRSEDTMTLTVWRDGRYEQLVATVPERWLGTRLSDFLGDNTPARLE